MILITGSGGLIGSSAVEYYCSKGKDVIGIDNDSRKLFFGQEASVVTTLETLSVDFLNNFTNHSIDIANSESIDQIFAKYNTDIEAVIHTAAQPSHDWASKDPKLDLNINLLGTSNLLESCRKYSPDAVFVFCSTNKVYGDRPNQFDYIKHGDRLEPMNNEPFFHRGFDETLSIDQCTHSLFGASKLGADILVQEYGRYFGMRTGCFRGGCLTGWRHRGAKLHGFLSFLIKKSLITKEFSIIGYEGLQVRDNIDADDVICAFDSFINRPSSGAVFNLGGGRENSISVLEALRLCEQLFSIKIDIQYDDVPRIGDHKWWISDMSKFLNSYPEFSISKSLNDIFIEIGEAVIGE